MLLGLDLLYPTYIYNLETPNKPKDKVLSLPDSWSWYYISFYKFCLASWSANLLTVYLLQLLFVFCILEPFQIEETSFILVQI
jgi:hypothetical protein